MRNTVTSHEYMAPDGEVRQIRNEVVKENFKPLKFGQNEVRKDD